MNYPKLKRKIEYHAAWCRILPGCCVLVFLTMGFGNNITGLFLQAVTQEIGLSYGGLSLSVTIQGIVLLLAVLIVPKCLYHGNARVIMSAAVFLLAGSNLFLSAGSAVAHWIIASVLIAISNAFLSTFVVSLILSEWFQESYSFALGICTAFSGLSGAVLNPFVSAVIEQYGWRAAYCVNAGVILAAGLPVTACLLRLKPEQLHLQAYGKAAEEKVLADAPDKPVMTFAEAARTSPFYLLLIASVAVAAFYMINPHIISITATLNLEYSVGVAATTLQMLTITVFRIVGNLWVDRTGARRACLIYFSAGALGMLLLLLLRPMTAECYFAAVFLYAVGASFLVTIVPVWVRTTFGTQNYKQIYPFFYSVFMVSMSGGASVAGVIYERTGTYHLVFVTVFLAFLIAAGCALLLPVRRQ